MVSERIQRRIDQLLDEADDGVTRRDWSRVRDCAGAVLRLDPDNADAKTYLAAAERDQDSPSPPSLPPTVTQPPLASPTSFANRRYTVKRFLGEGGKKRVFLAHDTTLARDVAFALIKTDGLDVEGRERITREAQAMGKLGTHPHVVSVFDMGSEGESPYLVTELMQGGDIEGLLEKAPEHRLAIPDAVSLAIQVCRGLEFAHSHGLVHRDLKPGNVWLTADGTAKIGDFGLAVSLDRSRLTRAGMMVGTVSYMPPEQAMGGEVSPRSDLYSLGAMLYEMVTGRPPFVGEESVAIITQHLNVPPVSPTWHRPECPPGLEALILRLLEKDAAKRPGSAAEVRQALEGGLAPIAGGAAAAQEPSAQAGTANDNPLYRRTFVGREHELRQLQATFDGAVSGNGALVMVVGEPGIGKTALCEQLATYVTVRGGKALVGHCYEEGSLSLPYLPFVEALRSYVLGAAPETLRSELGSGATDVARIVSEVREKVQVEPRSSGDPEDDRWRLYQSLTGFLRNASAVQPLLIVLEDIHWADRGTLDFLIHLSRNLQGARVLITGTYRDVEVDRNHPLSAALAELRRGSNFGRVPLRGLTAEEVQRMLTNLTGQEVRWSLGEAVHRQTEGNPLFIQEVLRYLVEEGIISRQDGRYRRSGEEAPEMRIPEGLRDVIGRRLSRLSPDCNRLLAIAAVIGRDFDLDALRRVAETQEEPLVQALEEAVRVGVLEEQERRGGVHYRFSHAFFRQTLYEELSAPRRIRMHQQVARALEAQYAARLEEHGAELAEHFSHSSDKEDLAKAVHYSVLAAGRASGVYAHSEAARLLQAAIEIQEILDPADQARCCDLLLALGDALLPAGEPQRALEEAAERAFALAEQLGSEERVLRACRMAFDSISRHLGITGRGGTLGRIWADRADRYARPGTLDRVYADLARGDAAASRGASVRLDTSWEWYQKALAEARRIGDRHALLECMTALGGGAPVGYLDELFGLAREVAALPRDGVSGYTLASALDFSAAYFLAAGDRRRAEELWHEVEALGARTRDPLISYRPVAREIITATLDGDLERALEAAERAVTVSAEAGSPRRGRQASIGWGAWPRLYLGRFHDALTAWQQAGDAWEGTATVVLQPRIGACLYWTGDVKGARRTIDELVRRWQEQPPGSGTTVGHLTAALELATLLGDEPAMRLLLPHVAPHAGLINTRGFYLSCIGRVLGDACAALADVENAEDYYRRGLAVCERVGFRPEVALNRLGLAEVLLRASPERQAEALNHLDFAIGEFQAMKMQPALERALKHKGLLHA